MLLLRFFVRSLSTAPIRSLVLLDTFLRSPVLVPLVDLEPAADRLHREKHVRRVYCNALMRAKVSRLPTECTLSRPVFRSSDVMHRRASWCRCPFTPGFGPALFYRTPSWLCARRSPAPSTESSSSSSSPSSSPSSSSSSSSRRCSLCSQ